MTTSAMMMMDVHHSHRTRSSSEPGLGGSENPSDHEGSIQVLFKLFTFTPSETKSKDIECCNLINIIMADILLTTLYCANPKSNTFLHYML